VRLTVPRNPFGSDAVHGADAIEPLSIWSRIVVVVSVGSIAADPAAQPAAWVVAGAASSAGSVVNVGCDPVRIGVEETDPSTRTWFGPGVTVPSAFWHWNTAKPLVLVSAARVLTLLFPASVPVQVVDEVEAEVLTIVHVGVPPVLKSAVPATAGLVASAPNTVTEMARTEMDRSTRM
jgi:hypothetical protein